MRWSVEREYQTWRKKEEDRRSLDVEVFVRWGRFPMWLAAQYTPKQTLARLCCQIADAIARNLLRKLLRE
jgi:hypothetical protein